ncbi:Hypothetical predicted protein, partial [Paramuricea clavata]
INRGGKLPKESCIPDSCFQIISTKCCEEEYSDRLTFAELECLLLKEKESLENVKMNPPPRIKPSEEEFRLEEHDPGNARIKRGHGGNNLKTSRKQCSRLILK